MPQPWIPYSSLRFLLCVVGHPRCTRRVPPSQGAAGRMTAQDEHLAGHGNPARPSLRSWGAAHGCQDVVTLTPTSYGVVLDDGQGKERPPTAVEVRTI
jgi:hypothetical protein